MIPFKVQFDKLTTAYINDKVEPYNPCACFIGNLLNGVPGWGACRHFKNGGKSIISSFASNLQMAEEIICDNSGYTYTPEDIVLLENNFLRILEDETTKNHKYFCQSDVYKHPNYENALFNAFSSTLDLLKKIHEEKGEKVDEFTFVKRKTPGLVTSLG